MLEYFFSLPDDEMDSENEPDEGASDDDQDLSVNSAASDVSSLLDNLERDESVLQCRSSQMLASDTVTFLPSPTAELFPELSVSSPTTAFHDKSSKVNSNDSESQSVAGTSIIPVSRNQDHEAHFSQMCVEFSATCTSEKQSPAPLSCSKLRLAEVVSDRSGWNNSTDEMMAHHIIPEIPPRPKNTFSKTSKEIDFFSVIMDDDTIAHIVKHTNLYASQDHRHESDSSKPRKIRNWVDTSQEEIRAFFGMLIIMGIHQLPHLCNYWSSDPILGVESVSKIMSLKRFKKLVEALHLNDNLEAKPKGMSGYDKLHKVRPLVKSLNENCSKTYHHSNRLSVDESMIPFKGRSGLKQYMPLKPVKRGYKVWCLADSLTGFVLKFDIYSGKTDTSDDLGLGERVVLNLCSGLADSQAIVAFDNFFTSYKLMVMLLQNGIYSIGTVRVNRKGLPDMLKMNDKLQRGEFMFSVKGPVAAVKWQDSKPVTVLSTATSPKDTTSVTRKNKNGTKTIVSCPTAIQMYNALMGGVDLFDQLRERYAVGRRSLKWWHRIFYFLLDLAVVNSFIMMKRVKGDLDQMSFRIRLARQLISGYTSKKRRGRPPLFIGKKKGSIGVPHEVRTVNVGEHLPKKNIKYRRCRLCSTRKEEKRTRVECTHCKVALCLDPCFRRFHEM